VHLHQHGHAQLLRGRFQRQHAGLFQRRDDQQDAVRAPRARLGHLILVDDEVLAQHRQPAGRARHAQVLGCALEELPVGQHAEAGRAVARIAGRYRGRIEILAQHALGRRGLLHLGDDGRAASGDGGAQRATEVAQVCARARLRQQFGLRGPRTRRGDLLALDRQDAVENVSHGCLPAKPQRRRVSAWRR